MLRKNHSHQFNETITYGNDHALRVTGRANPYIPATGPTTENAGGDPPEGGGMEDVKIYLVRLRKSGMEACREIKDLDGVLWDAIGDRVNEKVSKSMADALAIQDDRNAR